MLAGSSTTSSVSLVVCRGRIVIYRQAVKQMGVKDEGKAETVTVLTSDCEMLASSTGPTAMMGR